MYFVEMTANKFVDYCDELAAMLLIDQYKEYSIKTDTHQYAWVFGTKFTLVFIEPISIWENVSLLYAFEDENDALIFKLMFS
jgi:hypothetical protein